MATAVCAVAANHPVRVWLVCLLLLLLHLQLTELHCTNEELTDEGIHHLSSLTDLNTLALRDCCEVSGDALLVRHRGWPSGGIISRRRQSMSLHT